MRLISLILSAAVLVLFLGTAAAEDYTEDWKDVPAGAVTSRIAVHDPSILEADGNYYIFGTHMTAAASDDLRIWVMKADGYLPNNKVWGNLFSPDSHVFDYAGGPQSVIPTDDRG